MPKLIVLVEKDENGKLWDQAFTPNNWKDISKLLAASPLMIHKSGINETVCESAPSTPSREDSVIIGVIPQLEEIVEQVKTRSK